ncbi:MAG: diacylglycerol kinase family lipid kinase [Chitinophagaceae bacterium]|nr:diacylglycerol kinase family lipid kinase [Chitinophagaceae bacterium]
MLRKIVYLINPISGTKEKTSLKDIIHKKTTEQNIPFEIQVSSKNGNYENLRKKIIAEKITDVVICGGDGTISSVAAALMDLEVRFGIIPMGSGNGLALTAKIPVSPVKALEIIFQGNASKVDGLYINNQFSCMLCGLGFDAQVAHDFAKEKKRGLQTYVKISAINFFKASPYVFTIKSKEKNFETEAFFISIANSNQFGNNFKIAPHASLKDGLMDIVIVKKMNKLMLPFSILGQITGINALQQLDDHLNRRNIIYFQTKSIQIHNTGHAPLHIDGDPVSTSSVFNIRIKPKAFRLLQPS